MHGQQNIKFLSLSVFIPPDGTVKDIKSHAH